MEYTYTITNREEITNTHVMYEYDEQGNEIPGTETTWNTKTVITTVEYYFDNYGKHNVIISHFNPKNDDDIELGIRNRAITEIKKLESN
jgi:hypothetical protein